MRNRGLMKCGRDTVYGPRWNRVFPELDLSGLLAPKLDEEDFGLFNTSSALWNPSVDVKETDKEYIVVVEVPGVDKESIEVSLNREVVTISGEKSDSKEENSGKCFRVERSFGKFKRSFKLPNADYESDKINAETKDGILTLVIPKKDRGVRKIDIK